MMRSPYMRSGGQAGYQGQRELRPTRELGHLGITQGPDIRDWPLVDQHGRSIGRVRDVLIDTASGEGIFAIVDQSAIAGHASRRMLIPVDMLGLDQRNNRAVCFAPYDRIINAPEYDSRMRDYGPIYDYWAPEMALREEEEGPYEAEHAPRATEEERLAGRAGGMSTAEPKTEETTAEKPRIVEKPDVTGETPTEQQGVEKSEGVQKKVVVEREEDVPPPQF